MNIDEIKYIVNNEFLTNIEKEQAIIITLSNDKHVIPYILRILNTERKQKEELLLTINQLLSKAHVGLEYPKKYNKDHLIDKEIEHFYKTNKNVGHCFKDIKL